MEDLGETGRIGWVRSGGLAGAVGGVLWIPYGVFELLQPWGDDTTYLDDRGYEVIIDTALFIAYSLPGSLALLLTSLGLLSVLALLGLPQARIGKIGLLLAYAAVALAALSLVGVIVLFDPLFTAGRIFGSLVLGIATLLIGVDAQKIGVKQDWTLTLLILGTMGILLLPLWLLVHAVQWVPEAAGALFMALFGLGWLAAGYRVWSTTREGTIA